MNFLLGWPIFGGYVSFGEGIYIDPNCHVYPANGRFSLTKLYIEQLLSNFQTTIIDLCVNIGLKSNVYTVHPPKFHKWTLKNYGVYFSMSIFDLLVFEGCSKLQLTPATHFLRGNFFERFPCQQKATPFARTTRFFLGTLRLQMTSI